MTLSGPVLDAADVPQLLRFYEQLLGWQIMDTGGDEWGVVRPEDGTPGHKVEIQYEPNFERPVFPSAAGRPTMQIHLDFWVEDLERGVAWAIECGAEEASWQPPDRDPARLRIMVDPAGHPFCLWI